MLHHDVDEAILQSRHSILDKFLLSTLVFGFLAALSTVWRDVLLGFFAANTAINLGLIIIMGVLWIFRHVTPFNVKAALLFVAFLVIAIKQLFLFGPVSAGSLFFCFCCMIIMLSMNLKNGLIASAVLSLTIPLVGYLHFSGTVPVVQDFDALLNSKVVWLTAYTAFILTAFIVIVGVGQLRQELNKNFGLLRKSVVDLHASNDRLTEEIELKNQYADSLQISSKKFQSLFEGSRDGVLLLSSDARIIEANQAVVEACGYSLEELKEINIFQLIEERYRQDAIKRFEKNIQGELQTELSEMAIVSKTGKSVQVEINSNLILSDEEVMVLSTVRDVSFRRQVEQEKFNAVLEAEERERERFSKDLHDDLGPVFSTLNLYLQTLSNKENDESKRAMLNNLSDIVDSAVKQVREISHNLSPHLLRRVGLIEAVRIHLERYQEQEVVNTILVVNGDETQRLNSTVEIAFYRIFLELLNNTLKHSGATQVRVEIEKKANAFIFSYFDNGKGFDPLNRTHSGGIGLLNIESRIHALRGVLNFNYENHEMAIQMMIPL